MSSRKMMATSHRVLLQLRHDKRTLALIFVVPPALLTILKYVFYGSTHEFQTIAPLLLGIFPMIMMFLITSIVTLRERSKGTLHRLLTFPLTKYDFIFGYARAFCLLALVQAFISSAVMFGLLRVTVAGGVLPTVAIAVISAFLGTAMGLFMSAFARSEFQAVQFLPAFIFPQLLVCGLFVTSGLMTTPLQWFADIMPLTYVVDAMQQLAAHTHWTSRLTEDVLIVIGFGITFLILGSITIRRKE